MTDEQTITLGGAPEENIAQTVERISTDRHISADLDLDGSLVALPAHWKIEDLEPYLDRPRRVAVKQTLSTLEGFAAYVAAHALKGRTAVYVHEQTVTAVIDDIEPGKEVPTWRSHSAALALHRTPEWTAWKEASGRFEAQRPFVDFIQDRAGEIVEPPLAALVEQLRGINAESTGSRRDAAGHLTEEQKREQRVRITNQLPEFLNLSMPMLKCEPAELTQLKARLQVKLADAGVEFSVTLLNAPIVLDRRIREFVERLQGKVGNKAAVYF